MVSLDAIPRSGLSLLLISVTALGGAVMSFRYSGAEQVDHETVNSETAFPESSTPLESNPTVSDVEAEEVARQVLKLQEQLGGSIIGQSQMLSNRDTQALPQGNTQALPLSKPSTLSKWNRVAMPVAPKVPTKQPNSFVESGRLHSAQHEVAALRKAAWQLDTASHRLEQLDLYPQADALRRLAMRLRHDARGLKHASHGDRAGAF